MPPVKPCEVSIQSQGLSALTFPLVCVPCAKQICLLWFWYLVWEPPVNKVSATLTRSAPLMPCPLTSFLLDLDTLPCAPDADPGGLPHQPRHWQVRLRWWGLSSQSPSWWGHGSQRGSAAAWGKERRHCMFPVELLGRRMPLEGFKVCVFKSLTNHTNSSPGKCGLWIQRKAKEGWSQSFET